VFKEPITFLDSARARAHFEILNNALEPELLGRIGHLLAASPDPDRALDYMERMLAGNPAAFERLARSASGLQSMVAVFGYSRYLADEVLQKPEWLELVCASGDLHRSLSVEQMSDRLERFLPEGVPQPVLLARFRRQETLRIMLRDVRRFCGMAEVTQELSTLADAVLDVTYRRIRAELERKHGEPRFHDARGAPRRCEFSILAMGKLGGEELNYSSDIDLMFVYGENGETSGDKSISNKEFFKKVANWFTELLSSYTTEGMCYRVDLRLRPDGRNGEICLSKAGALGYYESRGRDWELQMLIKARVAAGEYGPGRELLEHVEPLIYATTTDFGAIEAVSQSRMRIHEKLMLKRGAESETDVKLCRGGIRDIEFLVQCLQRLHGGRERWVRHGGTLLALSRLRDKALLSGKEYARLATAYTFLRNVEHRLQFEEDRQTHSLPAAGTRGAHLLARRMPESHSGAEWDENRLRLELDQHREQVAEIYERVIHAHQPSYQAGDHAESGEPSPVGQAAASNLVRFLDQIAPGLAGALLRHPLARGAERFEHFLEIIRSRTEWMRLLDGDAVLAGRVLDIFENSPFLAEEVLRTPELLEEFALLGSPVCEAPPGADAAELRRWFRREMFRIQCESVCLARPVFETLQASSVLGERAIRAAYEIAVGHVREAHPPAAGYSPGDQLMVIALGRLGMYEFDLGSDAYLVFVLPSGDAHHMRFWTRVAEKLIDVISSYTGEGVIFAIDTRLRPNGREGPLVQTDAAYLEYFERQAQAWEGMAHMKSYAVAGNVEQATKFLHELQRVDWRRYGQSGRSMADLRKMRLRLEREQGSANPLKAGFGGYYDIDFALLYLRLRSAGIFYKQLNTPRRIDVVEEMGHLDRADAAFLRDAATFYRAIDHGLRLIHGHAEGTLPTAQAGLENLGELMKRWTMEHLHDQPLADELLQIQVRTREYFDRLFAP
jgi:[glutamine synthetase] adenylyltransferase / [glutamine synthetase]-adenylyl-L-tyrosine phosphorylase